MGNNMGKELDICGGVQLWRDAQADAMQLHRKPVRELTGMSVDEQRQALIEWHLQYAPISILSNEQGDPRLQWHFSIEEDVESRAQKVRRYEDFIDSLKGHPGFEMKEVKELVRERRNALTEAVYRASECTLDRILSAPGFERYERSKENALVLERNTYTFELLGAVRCYPVVLLYDLFNDPPTFLQRVLPDRIQKTQTSQFEPLLSERERTFIAWLEDAVKYAPDGWLTLAEINHRNALLAPAAKVFKLRQYKQVDSGNVRGLLGALRKHALWSHAIESGGKMWRLRDWENR